MNDKELTDLLQSLVDGQISVTDGVSQLKNLPFEDLGIARSTITASCAREFQK